MPTKSTEFGQTNNNASERGGPYMTDAQSEAGRTPVSIANLITDEQRDALERLFALPQPSTTEQELPAVGGEQEPSDTFESSNIDEATPLEPGVLVATEEGGAKTTPDDSSSPQVPSGESTKSTERRLTNPTQDFRNKNRRKREREKAAKQAAKDAPKLVDSSKEGEPARDATSAKDAPKHRVDAHQASHDDTPVTSPAESDTPPVAQDNHNTTDAADEIPIEGVVISHPQPRASSTNSTTPPSEHEVVVGRFIGSSDSKTDKQNQRPQDNQANRTTANAVKNTKPDDAYDVTYDNAWVAGPDDAKHRIEGNVKRHQERVEHYSELSREAVAKRNKGRLFEADGFVLRGTIKVEDVVLGALAKITKGRLKKPTEGFFQKKNRAIHETDEATAEMLQKLDRFTMAFDNSYKQQLALDPQNDEAAVQAKLAEYQQTRALQRDEQKRRDLTSGKVTYWMDKYAHLPPGKKALVSLGGAAVLFGAGTLAVTAGGVATLAGVSALGVIKVGKTYGQTRSNLLKEGPAISVPTAVDGVTGRTFSAREQIIAARDYTQSKREMDIKAADRNKKIATALATVAAVPVIGGVVHKFVDFGGEIVNAATNHIPTGIQRPTGILDTQGGGSGHNPIDKLGSGDVYHAPFVDTHAAEALAAAHNEFINSAANTIPTGGGGEAFALAHNMSPSIWYNNQAEFLAKFPNEAYQMPDGNVGFVKPGGLSKAAVEFWAAKAGR